MFGACDGMVERRPIENHRGGSWKNGCNMAIFSHAQKDKIQDGNPMGRALGQVRQVRSGEVGAHLWIVFPMNAVYLLWQQIQGIEEVRACQSIIAFRIFWWHAAFICK